MQMTTRAGIKLLGAFLLEPNKHNSSCLIGIPSLYNVIRFEESKNPEHYPPALLGVCSWLHDRAEMVYNALATPNDGSKLTERPPDRVDDWRKVRWLTYYIKI